MIKKLLLASMFIASTAIAQTRPWSDEEKYLGTALTVAILADWSSTRYAARQGWPNDTRESNLFLGRHPSVSSVDRHFAIGIPVIFWLLDRADEDRKTGLIALTAVEIYAAGSNARLGLKFKF